jgi:hypothetical protein
MCFVPRPRDGRRRRHARVRVKAVTATPRDTGPPGATGHTPRARPTRDTAGQCPHGDPRAPTVRCRWSAEARLDLERVDEGVQCFPHIKNRFLQRNSSSKSEKLISKFFIGLWRSC